MSVTDTAAHAGAAAAPAPGPAPVRKVVVRWTCPFCPRENVERQKIAAHVPECWKNPAAHGCLTCAHRIRPAEHGQRATCALELETPENKNPVMHCPSWRSRRAAP